MHREYMDDSGSKTIKTICLQKIFRKYQVAPAVFNTNKTYTYTKKITTHNDSKNILNTPNDSS